MGLNREHTSELFLIQEFAWLEQLINNRIESYFSQEASESIYSLTPPPISNNSPYEEFLLKHKFGSIERVIISMILASILKPQIFNPFLFKNDVTDTRYTEFGGKIEDNRFVPTYRTAAFILSENELPIFLFSIFQNEHPFSNLSILDLIDSSLASNIDSTMRLKQNIENQLLRSSNGP